MGQHVHPDPVCGFGAHRPHDPSCTEMDGRMIACGESDRPDWPYPGQALCGHADRPFFNPDKWNAILADLLNNNCYNYATCQKTGTFAQPGIGGCGHPAQSLGCPDLIAAVKADGLHPSDCDAPCANRCWKVALVVDPRPNNDGDFHWYRQDEDGTWSHKPGGTPATNLDASGRPITDPRNADRNYQPRGGARAPNYTVFCGCFCVCPPVSVASLDGRRTGEAFVAVSEPRVEVSLLIRSGLPNPSWALAAGQAAELARRLENLERTDAVPWKWLGVAVSNPSRTGGLPDAIALHDGVIEMQSGPATLTYRDTNGIFDWLLETGLESPHAELIERVRAGADTPSDEQ